MEKPRAALASFFIHCHLKFCCVPGTALGTANHAWNKIKPLQAKFTAFWNINDKDALSLVYSQRIPLE
jgi:hypothetical protein